ncbi:MAG: amidase [Candidatus Dormibacteraeota bacterium]|uniref:Amidase n=1 Tax=Candidatus Aeolococcus gillhamiae TaxID=3127015 RepID=A0A2W5YX27_9BACT|nr:amidase [Candidatus Dormibacteraeota bacterium]PZR77479.1 MAG: amidase [Candidatus Dormibacter sp. RRmetagenome_bin12]
MPPDGLAADALSSAAAVRARQISAVELVTASLEAIERGNPAINAFTVVLAEDALARAREADEEVSRGEQAPLLGVPITIKDHIWMRGAVATNGSLAYRDFVPDADCEAVARLRAAGAVIVGKTNNPEFCYRGTTDNRVFGLTRNPWNLDRTPGGSSGGAGASVAAGMAPIALGTDGGGSVRIPASFCGIVGHKPSFGLVPKEPGFKGWKTLSVDGPITRSVRDAALALSVMAGPSTVDDMTYPVAAQDYVAAATEERGVEALRVAVSVDMGFAAVDPDVRRAFARALDTLSNLGCRLTEAHPPTGNPMAMWNLFACCEGYASEGPLLQDWEPQMSAGSADLIRAGRDLAGWEYVNALHARSAYTRAWAEFFTEYDVLVSPCMQLTAFGVDILSPPSIDGVAVDPFFDDWCSLVLPANLTGQPALSLPMGFGDDGLPVGMQVMGRRFDDATVFELAAAYERTTPWHEQMPPAAEQD